jgi:hypothetical protein
MTIEKKVSTYMSQFSMFQKHLLEKDKEVAPSKEGTSASAVLKILDFQLKEWNETLKQTFSKIAASGVSQPQKTTAAPSAEAPLASPRSTR